MRIFLTILGACTLVAQAHAQDRIANPFEYFGVNPTSNATSEQLKNGCDIAASFRKAMDSLKCDCNISNQIKGGSMPSDGGDCAAPAANGSTPQPAAVYGLGSRPSCGSVVDPAPSGKVDCSGWVSSGLCVAGIPFSPGQACKDLTTQSMLESVNGGKSCYEAIPAGKQPNLMPGDLIVYQHSGSSIGHVFTIDRLDTGDCKKFSINQSAGPGVELSMASGSGGRSDDQGLAIEAAQKVNCGGSSSTGDRFKVVRYNDKKPGCAKQQPRPLKNEACVKNCDVGKISQ